MNIESEAVSKVSEVLRRTEYLEPFIPENDKTPVWDGFVIVYNDNKHPHRKDSLRGRVSVQVKGRKVSDLTDKNIKYSVSMSDLKAFQKDGGAIFFIVYITPAYLTKIYYKVFLPLDLGRIIKENSNQKSVTLDFILFPNDQNMIMSIFFNFLSNQKKQISTVDNSKLYLKDWDTDEIVPTVGSLTMPVSFFKDANTIPFELITSMPQYLYITPKNFEQVNIPVDIIENIAISRDLTGPISIGSKVYYSEYKVIWYDGNPTIQIGKGLSVLLKKTAEEDKVNSYKVSVNLTTKGSLQERIKDINFFLEFYNNTVFSINSIKFPLSDHKNIEKDLFTRFKNILEELYRLQRRLDELQINEDLDIEDFFKNNSNEDWKLNILLNIGKERSIGRKNAEVIPKQILEIANIRILLFVTLRDDKEIDLDYYSPQFELIAKENEEAYEETYMSQYTILKENDLTVSNFKGEIVFEDIIKYAPTSYYLTQLTLFLLEVIKAYDSQKGKTEELYELALKLSNWLYDQSNEFLYYINYLQVIKRKTELSKEDIERLQEGLETYKNELYLCTGIYILLEEKEKVRELLKNRTKEEQKTFKEYPIYRLLEI